MDKISPIKKRILHFIENQSITKVEFCKNTGISYANLKGKSLESEIGGDSLAEILSVYGEISAEWLITGIGIMLKTVKTGLVEQEAKYNAVRSDDGVPLIPIEAMAGFGVGDATVMAYDITDRYVVPDFADVDFMIRVKGSSMYPKYNSGDVIACKKLPLDTFIQWNKVYVLDTTQGAMVKRVNKSDIQESWLLVSDNQAYPPFDIPMKEVRSLAIVVGVIRLE